MSLDHEASPGRVALQGLAADFSAPAPSGPVEDPAGTFVPPEPAGPALVEPSEGAAGAGNHFPWAQLLRVPAAAFAAPVPLEPRAGHSEEFSPPDPLDAAALPTPTRSDVADLESHDNDDGGAA
jgi:hypothetical protein